MFCSHCGKELMDGARYCPNCGAKVEIAAEESSSNSSSTLSIPTAYAQVNNAQNCAAQRKSKTAASLFAFFLGVFGAHNFYLGYNGKAVAQLLITVLSCFTLSGITAIWSFVEFILILIGKTKDSTGLELKD